MPATTKRRGAAAVAVIIIMVVVNLIVLGVVLRGARDEVAAVRRVDAVRAEYAAYGAVQMGVRELIRKNDDDGDGGVGSVSDDGNDANDPLIGTARSSAEFSVAGSDTTVAGAGRLGESVLTSTAVVTN